MKFETFSSSFKVMKKENTWGRFIILGCLAVIFLLTMAIFNQKPIVTVIPPQLSEEAKLHHNKASSTMHQAWGLYVAESLGNVTPDTAGFVRSSLEPLLSPSIRSEALVILDQQIDLIRRDQVSFSFEPREVLFDEDSARVYVIGRHFTHTTADGNPDRTNRTYEFEWAFSNYMPSLVHIDTYKGAPRFK